MASFVFNIWKQKLALGDSIWDVNPAAGDTMKIALSEVVLSVNAAYKDADTLTAMTSVGVWEYGSSAPYTRTAVIGQGATVDDSGDLAKLDATDTTVLAVALDGTDQVTGVVLYHDVDGTDGNAIPIAFFDTTPFYGNGSDILFTWNASGLITLT